MISRRQMLILGGAAAITWPGRAQEKPKAPHYALIIGNAAYSDGIGPLENSVSDALLVADAIRNCRFELVTGDVVRDADRSTMLSSLREYANLMEGAGPDALGFLYYAGHGAAHEDRGNFLIPVQEAAELDDALWDDSISLESVMSRLAKLEAPSVVAIDACRNVLRLPAAQRALGGGESFRGLRRSAGGVGERNMFLSFATWEGETASDGFADEKNGPYATSLATRLAAPPVTVRDMFEQVRKRTCSGMFRQAWACSHRFRFSGMFRWVRAYSGRFGHVRTGTSKVSQVRTGSDRFGQVRTGSDTFGQFRTGSGRFGQVRTGADRRGQIRTCSDSRGHVRKVSHRFG